MQINLNQRRFSFRRFLGKFYRQIFPAVMVVFCLLFAAYAAVALKWFLPAQKGLWEIEATGLKQGKPVCFEVSSGRIKIVNSAAGPCGQSATANRFFTYQLRASGFGQPKVVILSPFGTEVGEGRPLITTQ